ncbi:MAG TPA: hypothetical protein ENJ11_00085, partial [Gammaproteobacteria bacterium]|nr:hypothetical protein [Gammaproteobacteria bacterium]
MMNKKSIQIVGLLALLAALNVFAVRASLAESDHDGHEHEVAEAQHTEEEGHDEAHKDHGHDESGHQASGHDE